MERSIKMIRRVGGVMGELGRGLRPEARGEEMDIFSIGPLFQELDHRFLGNEKRKVPFVRFEPSIAALH